ncbi:GNAT family protein [Streptomyces sp. V4-01]|uniref:GNAT family protein n=1 Tax=Actinacidiphila polyblastidii TaxID=3110430 RepID=A0ABU7PMR0_9ACTN|nr:GNAT family protein [Streptomyces sp. V4-01]
MIRHGKITLRAREERDVDVLHRELYEDVENRARSDHRPWRPLRAGPDSPYAVQQGDETPVFSIEESASGDLAGVAALWGVDTHSRSGHLGIGLRPSFRGRGLGTDTVRALCVYGFTVRGLHRLQVDTLADNAAMIAAARHCGFVVEGTLRKALWVYGRHLDEVVLGLLAEEWAGVQDAEGSGV